MLDAGYSIKGHELWERLPAAIIEAGGLSHKTIGHPVAPGRHGLLPVIIQTGFNASRRSPPGISRLR